MTRKITLALLFLGIGLIALAVSIGSVSRIEHLSIDGTPLSPGIHFSWVWDQPERAESTLFVGTNVDSAHLETGMTPALFFLESPVRLTDSGRIRNARVQPAVVSASQPTREPKTVTQALTTLVREQEALAQDLEQLFAESRTANLALETETSADFQVEHAGQLEKYRTLLVQIESETDEYVALRTAEADALEIRHASDNFLESERIQALEDTLRAAKLGETGGRAYSRLSSLRSFRIHHLKSHPISPNQLRELGSVRAWTDFFDLPTRPVLEETLPKIDLSPEKVIDVPKSDVDD